MKANLKQLMRITEQSFYRASILAKATQSKTWAKRRDKIEKDLGWIYNLIMYSK